ncbi:MAG: RluA family pseudouridine synthase [bacterium]|nr:RluA family pseudouridine synthase [bacterium]
MIKLIVDKKDQGIRLDQYLFQKNPDYSRSYFSHLIKNKLVIVNDSVKKASYRIETGDKIKFDLIEKQALGPIEAENIPLDVIFENKDVVVVNKQAGLVVHPATGNHSGTLVNALAYNFPRIKDAVIEKGSKLSESRPGLVHRLDKDTSGILIVAKNTKAMISLSKQIKDRKVKKKYWAICGDWPKTEKGRLVNYLGRDSRNRKSYTEVGKEKGREAISNFRVINYFTTKTGEKVSLIEFDIETGRTHQIRTQAKIAGFPVLGDTVYNSKKSLTVSRRLGIERQMLHAKKLSIILPGRDKQQHFEAPPPADFSNTLAKLNLAD